MGNALKVGDIVQSLIEAEYGELYKVIEIDNDHVTVEGTDGKQWVYHHENLSLALEVELVEAQADHVLPTDSAARKAIPVVSGVLDYFPSAIAEVAKVSKAGNEQHHPGEPLHWERGKSTDHADTIVRHLMERGSIDTDGQRHSAKVAWRALGLLQEELEAAGAPKARGSR